MHLKKISYLTPIKEKNSFSFALGLNNVTYKVESNGSITFYDASSGEPVWTAAKPFMVDAKGTKSEDVQLSVSQENKKLILTVTADDNWLRDTNRSYPVVVDPTLYISSGIDDTYIVGDSSNIQNTWHFNGKQELIVGMGGPDYVNGTIVQTEWYKTFLNFHLEQQTECPEKIISAKVKLFRLNSTYSGNPSGQLIPYLGRVTSQWSPDTITSNNKPTLSTEYKIAPSVQGDCFTYDVTGIVYEYKVNYDPEYGFYLSNMDQTSTMGLTKFYAESSGVCPPQMEFEFENQYYAGYIADTPTVMIAGQTIQVPVNVMMLD